MQATTASRLNWLRHPAVNALLFQLGWFICVLGGSTAALLFTIPYLVFHFGWYSELKGEWRYTLIVLALGLALDSLNLAFGVFETDSGFPIWLACLWILLATLLPHGLHWLRYRPLLAATLGAIGGMASYNAGILMGVAETENLTLSRIIWMAQWCVLIPGLLIATDRIKAAQN